MASEFVEGKEIELANGTSIFSIHKRFYNASWKNK